MATPNILKSKADKMAKQAGFTIIELMVATLVFSLVLFGLTVGVMQITDDYYDGITLNKTRVATNDIINNISQSLAFNGAYQALTATPAYITEGSTTVTVYNEGFCIGPYLYSYLIGYELVPNSTFSQANFTSPYVFVVDNDNCNKQTTPQDLTSTSVVGTELMSPNMRLLNFLPGPSQTYGNPLPDSNLDFYQVDVGVLYGDTGDISGESQSSGYYNQPASWSSSVCNGGPALQFCAVSEVSTYVSQRTPLTTN